MVKSRPGRIVFGPMNRYELKQTKTYVDGLPCTTLYFHHERYVIVIPWVVRLYVEIILNRFSEWII